MQHPIRRAVLSVSDKTGLADLALALKRFNVELVSTGGTAKALRDLGLDVTDISALTGFPEIMDGRVKTLHPKVHGGLLASRGKAAHRDALQAHDIAPIDLLVVNLYPFEETIAAGRGWDEAIENIDIGGPAMIRSAAKNHDWLTVVTDPTDYAAVIAELDRNAGGTSPGLRRRLAAKAFGRTAAYDAAIAQWFAQELGDAMPERLTISGRLLQSLRYGENPHQQGAFYRSGVSAAGLAAARQIQGKELSYNNINDADAALECVSEFDPGARAACVIVKHANPCGVALGATPAEAYAKALRCDPVSAFGGIIAFNRAIDAEAAAEIVQLFTEVIIAPDATPEARDIIAGKKNLRLLLIDPLPDPKAALRSFKSVSGGFLVQSRDATVLDRKDIRIVTRRQPSDREMDDLIFAFTVAKHVKSNAIVYAKDGATVGIGAGQMSRVDSSRIAASKSAEAAAAQGIATPLTQGSVVASDAFFPFADGLLAAIAAGATAVIQPGGSVNDADVIAAADAAGIAMVFTGLRHFRH
ncbi:MAG: bifunctional phosphoribosylaminoimidazolecarboxamide formyltransferase/IMP cyclohydrolase [Rhizobiales bacterium]|nr:bifunctional phosphoribosylaminoimidazolecarboxamide formyltransferase/IMP cyclohydrolase [Hyphomicrobiales bacterium]